MRYHSHREIEGFTVIELMVTLFIFTVILGCCHALLSSGSMIRHTGETSLRLQRELRLAIDTMAYEISLANANATGTGSIAIGAGGNSITFQVPVDENASGIWQDTDSPGDGVNDFYFPAALSADSSSSEFDLCWGAYLMQEDKGADSATQGSGNRIGRTITFLLVGDELRRRVRNTNGAILEDFTLARDVQRTDGAQPINFSTPSSGTVLITVNSEKTTIKNNLVRYGLSTVAYLKNRE